MLFDTQVPSVQNYVADPTTKPQFNGNWLTKLGGYDDSGNKTLLGKGLSTIMPAVGFAADLQAHNLAKGTEQESAVSRTINQDIARQLAITQLAAGIATSNPSMIAGGGMQLPQTYMKDGGILNGGSHRSGNDLALVHAKSGEDTHVRLEGGELLFSKENTDLLKKALKSNDHKRLMKVVKKQLANGGSPNIDNDGDEEYFGGTSKYGIPYTANYSNNINISNPSTWGLLNGSWGGVPMSNDTYDGASVMADVNPMGDTPTIATSPNYYSSMIGENNQNGNVLRALLDNQESTTPTSAPPTSPEHNKWAYLAEALPYAAQTAYGLQQTKAALPTITEPLRNAAFVNELQRLSHQGYTPEEKALFNTQAQSEYARGVYNAKENSGGNAAALMGALGNLSLAKHEANLKLAAQDAALRRENLMNYGNALNTEAQLYNIPSQQWAMQQAAAARAAGANLAQAGMGNLEGLFMNQKAENDPLRLAMLKYYQNGIK